MRVCIWVVLLLTLLTSCRDNRWSSKAENRFILKHTIDTTQYQTIEELSRNKQITKIITSDSTDNYCHFYSPLIYNNQYIYIEKKYFPDKEKNVILKLDRNGNIIDSIIINKYSTIINNYIIEKDFYISWFVDNDKKIKKFENINYFSKSDTTKLKGLVKSLKNDGTMFYATSEHSSNENIDTCNFIISFKNNKLQKFNYLKSIKSEYSLGISNNISFDFSKEYEEISMVTTSDLYKIDNFFAKTHETYIPGNKINFNLHLNGGGMNPCNHFYGTYFITLPLFKIKLKRINQSICDDEKVQEFSECRTFLDKSLNFRH